MVLVLKIGNKTLPGFFVATDTPSPDFAANMLKSKGLQVEQLSKPPEKLAELLARLLADVSAERYHWIVIPPEVAEAVRKRAGQLGMF